MEKTFNEACMTSLILIYEVVSKIPQKVFPAKNEFFSTFSTIQTFLLNFTFSKKKFQYTQKFAYFFVF